jgi:predicted Zn-dependent protease
LGDQAVQQFLKTRPETEDAGLAARVDAIGRRLSAHSDRPDVFHRALVVTGSDLQAFAFLGGTVAVTEALARGLDDDEAAFTLAHEMAHVDLRHQPGREVVEDVVREAAGGAAAADAALSMHDRHAEMEADRFGALYAVRAGFRFSAAASALGKIKDGGGLDQDAKHPAYAERMRALEAFETELRRAIEAFDRGCAAMKDGRVSDAVDYLALFVAEFPNSLAGQVDLGAAYLSRWRVGRGTIDGLAEELPILSNPGVAVRGGFGDVDVRNARSHFEAALRLDPTAAPARAGIALVLLREKQTAEARRYLQPVENDPGLRPEVLLLLGNADYIDEAWGNAVGHYQAALQARPGWNSARANLARTLERGGRVDEAKAQWEQLRDDAMWGSEARRRTEPAAAVVAPAGPPPK